MLTWLVFHQINLKSKLLSAAELFFKTILEMACAQKC